MLAADKVMCAPNPFKFAKALWRVAKAWFCGDEVVANRMLQWKREATCWECDRYDKNFDQCQECSCFIRLKTVLKTESCPLDKW